MTNHNTADKLSNDLIRFANVVYDLNQSIQELTHAVKIPSNDFLYYHGLCELRKSVLEAVLKVVQDTAFLHGKSDEWKHSEFYKNIVLNYDNAKLLVEQGLKILQENKILCEKIDNGNNVVSIRKEVKS